MILFYIGAGAAAGAIARYGLGGWVHSWAGSALPWGTFTINTLGSLLVGFAVGWLAAVPATPETRALITVGLLGGFTTFSTYTYETIALLQEGEWLRAGWYALGSLCVGLLAVVVGIAAAGAALQARG